MGNEALKDVDKDRKRNMRRCAGLGGIGAGAEGRRGKRRIDPPLWRNITFPSNSAPSISP